MHTHEKFGLATGDTERHCCKKEAPVLDCIQIYYCEAIIKLKEASVRFKNISASDVLFKNEIKNEHTAAPLYINTSFTDGTKCIGVEFSSKILAGISLKIFRFFYLSITVPLTHNKHHRSSTDTQ
jgi:hypothetical protein